jgi:hypothetical protein
MASLDSSSTLAEIEAAYLDNVSYEEDNSTAKAAAFITACKMLLLKRPSSLSAGGSVTFGSQSDIRAELEAAQRWLSQSQEGGSVKHLDFRNVRS